MSRGARERFTASSHLGPLAAQPASASDRLGALRVAVLRRLYRVAWRLVQLRAQLWPRRGRGVKCVLTQRGRVLLVRHTYGQRRTWYLPGGAVRRRETPLQGAAREMEEELGVGDLALRELVTQDISLERIAVRLTCLHAELPDVPTVRPDPVEIAEAKWFALGALPVPRGVEVEPLLALLPLPLAGSVSSSGDDIPE